MTNDSVEQGSPVERVYVLVAVDKDAVTNAAPFVSAALCSFLFVDQYAVADVTDLLGSPGGMDPEDADDVLVRSYVEDLLERLS